MKIITFFSNNPNMMLKKIENYGVGSQLAELTIPSPTVA